MMDMVQKNMVDGIDRVIPTDFCDVCIQSKQSRKPFTGHLEHICSDLWGPIHPVAWNDSKYFLIFIDNFTHFCVVYMLKIKSKTFNKFITYEAEVESQD